MPNITVPAAGEAMPAAKFNRSAIMKAAWSHYRSIHSRYVGWQIERGIVDGSFSNALRVAWTQAKKAAAEPDKARRLWTGPDAELASAIRREIDMLAYKSLRYDVVSAHHRLEAELAALAA